MGTKAIGEIYMPSTFPSPLLAHQGLILPVARRWPDYFDVLALFVGAAMPDVIDISLGFLVTGYFKQWYGHALIGVVIFDIPGGLLLTWLMTVFATHLLKSEVAVRQNIIHRWQTKISLWSFSVIVGVLSHLGFDLISHETNLLLYPWYENVRWFPKWWYTAWFKIQLSPMFGHSYSVGPHTVIWSILTIIGTFLFYQYIFQIIKVRNH